MNEVMSFVSHIGPIFQVGDRYCFPGDTNAMRRCIVRLISATEAEAVLYRRPSRGFARHVRRRKAARR